LTNAPVLEDIESLANRLNAYPMVQPMKAALYFSDADGFEEWQIFMSIKICADSVEQMRRYSRSRQED
jgi:hypothetical protein